METVENVTDEERELDEQLETTVDQNEVLEGEVFLDKIEIPDEFTPCLDKETISKKDAYLSTGDVKTMLGVNHRNVVLRYTTAFYDFLAVYRDPVNSRYRYTEESVRQLAFIINDVKNTRRTIQQEIDFLTSKAGGKLLNVATDNVSVMEQLFETMQNNIIESNRRMLQESQQQLISHFEDSSKALLESKDESDSLKKLEQRLEEQQYTLQSIVQQKDREIEELKKQIKDKDEELAAKKKKKFLIW